VEQAAACSVLTAVAMNPNTSPPVVLIHGLWLNALSWEHWVERYRQRGCNVIARSWPGVEGNVADLREDPTGMEHVGIQEVVDHYAKIIGELDQKPIIIGHSFGALVTQILLDDGWGVAGVSIDSAPIKGVYRLPWSTLRSGFPALKNPGNRHRAVTLTPDEFHYAFTNTMSDEDSKAAYDRYAVPGPGRPLFQSAFANFNPHAASRIDLHNDERAPLLIIAGGVDHVSPPAINRSIAKLQHKSKALTAYKEFPGRSHFILGQPGWEEVADFSLEWALAPRELD
jgi:pimeloyl-ACP methyl ester carboxylesterase